MRSCFVLGSGRSGTSMVASLFADAGYFVGDRPLSPGPGNPQGFFESLVVNAINEDLLDQVIPCRSTGLVHRLLRWHSDLTTPPRFQRWAARPTSRSYELSATRHQISQMQHQLRRPFCLKDPRFCWTLPVWRPLAPDAVVICVFRHPVETIASILKFAAIDPGMRDYLLDRSELVAVWRDMYSNILKWADAEHGDWAFVEYESALSDAEVVEQLSRAVNVSLSSDIPDRAMRTVRQSVDDVPPSCREIYAELQSRALPKV